MLEASRKGSDYGLNSSVCSFVVQGSVRREKGSAWLDLVWALSHQQHDAAHHLRDAAERENLTPVSQQTFPAFPRPQSPVLVLSHEKGVFLSVKAVDSGSYNINPFPLRSVQWACSHTEMSTFFCKNWPVSQFSLSQNKLEMRSTWNNSQHVLLWSEGMFTCASPSAFALRLVLCGVLKPFVMEKEDRKYFLIQLG